MFLQQFKLLDAGVSYGSPVSQTQGDLNLLSLSAAEVFSSGICVNGGVHCTRQQGELYICYSSLCKYYRAFVIWVSINTRPPIQSKRQCEVNKSKCFLDKSDELAVLLKCNFSLGDSKGSWYCRKVSHDQSPKGAALELTQRSSRNWCTQGFPGTGNAGTLERPARSQQLLWVLPMRPGWSESSPGHPDVCTKQPGER